MTTCMGKSSSFDFTMCVFRERLSTSVFASFTFSLRWDVGFVLLVPDHCLYFYYATFPVPPNISLAEFFFKLT